MAQVNFISAMRLVELLTEANHLGRMNVRVLTTNKLALGIDPLHPSSVIDLSKELVRPFQQGRDQAAVEPAPPPPRPSSPEPATPNSSTWKPSRTTGRYSLNVDGKNITCRSLKELLAEGLKAFELYKPGTLQKLSSIKPRSKHIVSEDPKLLFENPDLVEKYTEKLIGDWWYGTNNSAQETQAWLKRGAELCGLDWGNNVTISLPQQA